MRKLVLTLVAFIAVVTFIRVYSNPATVAASETQKASIENSTEP